MPWYSYTAWFGAVPPEPATLWQILRTYPSEPSYYGLPYTASFLNCGDLDLALTWAQENGTLTLEPYDPTDSSQQWTILPGGVDGSPGAGIISQAQLALDLPGGIWSGAIPAMTPLPPNGGTSSPTNLWSFAPCFPSVDQWLDLVWQPTAATEPPLAATVVLDGQHMSSGMGLELEPPGSSQGSMWRYTLDGFVASGVNPDLVLSVDTSNNVVVYPKQETNNSFQQWAIVLADAKQVTFMLVNQFNNQALTGPSDPSSAQGSGLSTQPVAWGSPSQTWTTSVGYPVDTLLIEPPVPFPAQQNAAQVTAYSYMSSGVYPAAPMPAGIRATYSNMALDLTNYSLSIESMTQQQAWIEAGVDESDWNIVADQLVKELEAAGNVRQLFADLSTFQTQFEAAQEATVSALVSEFAVSTGSGTSGVLGSVMEGLLYAALSAAPGGAPVLANLMQTGLNAVAAASSAAGSNSLGLFSGNVSELESKLAASIGDISTSLGQVEQVVLADWGKMQAINQMVALPQASPWSLSWSPQSAGDLVTAALPGYQVEVLKFLLPAKYSILEYVQLYTGVPFSTYANPPSGTWWSEVLNLCVYNAYVIEEKGNAPSPSGMQTYVWDNGVQPFNLYRGSAGWKFNRSRYQIVQPGWGGLSPNNYLLTTVANNTPFPLVVAVDPWYSDPFSWSLGRPSTQSCTIPPFDATSFALCHNTGGLAAGVTLTDTSITENPVVNVSVHQDYSALSAGDVWVAEQAGSQGDYTYKSTCVVGSWHDSLPGTITLEILFPGWG